MVRSKEEFVKGMTDAIEEVRERASSNDVNSVIDDFAELLKVVDRTDDIRLARLAFVCDVAWLLWLVSGFAHGEGTEEYGFAEEEYDDYLRYLSK